MTEECSLVPSGIYVDGRVVVQRDGRLPAPVLVVWWSESHPTMDTAQTFLVHIRIHSYLFKYIVNKYHSLDRIDCVGTAL